MIPNRTPQPAAQAIEENSGRSLQQWVSPHQSTPRAESMPYMVRCRPNSTLAKRLTHQIIDPPFPRAQSSSTLRHAGPHCQRAQSSPLMMRGGMLDCSPPYENGPPSVQNTPIYSQNDDYHNGPLTLQNRLLPIPNYSLPFNNSWLSSYQNGKPTSIPHYELGVRVVGEVPILSAQPRPNRPSSGNNPNFLPSLNSRRTRSPSTRPPPTPSLLYRKPIALSEPVPQVPPWSARHSMEEKSSYLFSPPIGIMS